MNIFDQDRNHCEDELLTNINCVSPFCSKQESQITELDLVPAVLICELEKETSKTILRPLRQTIKSHIIELRIGGDSFSVGETGVTPLLEATYSSIETTLGRFALPASGHECLKSKMLRERLEALEEANAMLEAQVNSDALTGLLNRRGLENVLARELSFAHRTGNTLLAALVDLDDFKSFNDNYGHHIGDEVLKFVAQALKDRIRGCDWSSRIGGDEFLILLPSTSLEQGISVLDRVRMSICKRTIVAAVDLFLHTSISIGLAQIDGEVSTIEDVLRATTSLLKASKRAGKNRISIKTYSPEETQTLSNEVASYLESGEILVSASASRLEEKC